MKRLFDIVISASLLVLLSPLLALLALLVRAKLGSPVLFRQIRPGRDAKPFAVVKFRTMTDKRDSEGRLLPSNERLTSFGRRLRSTSLDELPELWNVLKGDMSLVGPRPLLMDYLSAYSSEQMRRHEVRPGITGWAQVNGRNSVDWEEKFKMDIWYVDHHNMKVDIFIILKTILTVLERGGINAADGKIMKRFEGNGN